MTLTIELPWPDKALSPNGRVHWARLAKAKQTHRGWAALAARNAMANAKWPKSVIQAAVKTRFVDPSKRRRDRDNHQAMCKAYLDGFADAGVIVNDTGFVTYPAVFEVGNPRGVVFEISECE